MGWVLKNLIDCPLGVARFSMALAMYATLKLVLLLLLFRGGLGVVAGGFSVELCRNAGSYIMGRDVIYDRGGMSLEVRGGNVEPL